MAFIGNTNTTQGFTPAIDYFSGNASTTAFTLSRPVASVAQVQAVVNNVAQNPSDAFTVSGSTITFTSAPSSGTNNIYVYYTSPITQVIAPSQGTVGTTQLQNGLTVNFADGSAAAPSITNDGDLNTGIFFPAADTIAFSEGGSEVMRIDSSGNVGIGTASPSSKLHVAGGSGSTIRNTASVGSSWFVGSNVDSYILHNESNTPMVFTTNGTERMRIDSSGNVGVNSGSPAQYATSGKVLNVTGTAVNSGPANLYMSGSSTTLGSGFNSNEVFAITGVTAATEITRVTGTGSNGFRAYFKITVTGHTSAIGNGINIKEYYWDASTGAPVQISTYTNGVGTPTISFDNTTSNVCIVKLASSNGSSEFRGVMKVEWMLPIDFANNTWTIS